MRKVYYIYNPQTQTYDRIYPTVRQRALSILRRLFYGMGLGAGCFIVLLLIFGIFLSVLGILNIKGNISTIHSYNRRKVKEEDIPKYGKAVGTGTVIMGASLILAYFATFWNEAAIDYIIFPAITIGLAFILYGQIKYNHGIF